MGWQYSENQHIYMDIYGYLSRGGAKQDIKHYVEG